MTRELENKLFEKYPKIFAGKDLPITQNLMSFGFECDDGWYWIIDNLCGHIQSYLDNNTHLNIPQVVATQVKEKYGTLRFYFDGGNDYIYGMVSHTEYLSGTICEECGSHEEIGTTQGWYKTLCFSHWISSNYKEFKMNDKYFVKTKDGIHRMLTEVEYDNYEDI